MYIPWVKYLEVFNSPETKSHPVASWPPFPPGQCVDPEHLHDTFTRPDGPGQLGSEKMGCPLAVHPWLIPYYTGCAWCTVTCRRGSLASLWVPFEFDGPAKLEHLRTPLSLTIAYSRHPPLFLSCLFCCQHCLLKPLSISGRTCGFPRSLGRCFVYAAA